MIGVNESYDGQKMPGTIYGGQTADVTPEDRARHKQAQELATRLQSASTSLRRIESAIEGTYRNPGSPLLKSDLDNAAKHAAQISRTIREVKAVLFPPAPKEETDGAAKQ